MSRCLLLTLIALTMGCPESALGQIVNVQQLAGKPIKPGLTAQAAVTGDWLSGNSQLATAGGSGSVFWRAGPWLSLVTVAGAYGRKGSNGKWAEDPFQSKIFEHVRVRRELQDGLSLEGFAQHEYDRWRRLKLRMVTGGGVRYDMDAAKGLHLAGGVAYMAQWEALLKPQPVDSTGLVLEHRVSSYFVGAADLSENSALLLTVYVQPKISDVMDLRGLVDIAVVLAASKAVALRVNWALGYDTRPPATVRGYDTTGKVALVVGF